MLKIKSLIVGVLQSEDWKNKDEVVDDDACVDAALEPFVADQLALETGADD